jgi:molybdate transport system substrate-binding protein
MSAPPALRGISSMATRLVLAELAEAYLRRGGQAVVIESVGGVDAARRVQAGEDFDAVILASDAIDKLEAGGHVLAGSRVDLVRSRVAACIPQGAARPPLDSQQHLQQALLAASTIGYSTGPSGTALLRLFEQWGMGGTLAPRIVQAPPGVPVASLVARGEVALGFQQLPELIHVQGIQVLALPADVQIVTTFSGAVCAVSQQADATRAMLGFMASDEAAEAKRRQGMEPA